MNQHFSSPASYSAFFQASPTGDNFFFPLSQDFLVNCFFYQGKVSSNSPVIPLQITLNHPFAQSQKEQCVTREKSGRFLKVALLE